MLLGICDEGEIETNETPSIDIERLRAKDAAVYLKVIEGEAKLKRATDGNKLAEEKKKMTNIKAMSEKTPKDFLEDTNDARVAHALKLKPKTKNKKPP